MNNTYETIQDEESTLKEEYFKKHDLNFGSIQISFWSTKFTGWSILSQLNLNITRIT
jgi:hypothetical protein